MENAVAVFLSRRPVFSSATWPTKILKRIQYFRRLGKPMKLTTLFSSVVKTDENTCLFCRPAQPMKILHLFSSVSPIFVDFIPSVYFRRPTDEYIYF
jgi:hypothetical protein